MRTELRTAAITWAKLMALATLMAFSGGILLSAANADWFRLAQSTTPPAGPPPEARTGSATTGTPAAVLDDQEFEGILGKSVRSSAGEDMGRVVDIIVNRAGHVRAAIIDFGGFLGVGSRKIAVDWNALRFGTSRKDPLTLELMRNQVRVAPEYKTGEPVVVLGAAGGTQSTPDRQSQPATPEK